ncbi:YhgE/Pip family protein [Sporolactobacillus spathodeae]|uniref:Membrane protein n=1 Tax=Sporolactobacillus spathodeae TaxID=1465502 RepID=A0ABS2Q7Y4_9BACL|nr:YhgE/Pip domain-containing protein [Sporolactobacillus spathodeae]MBM7657766.1 putative membrane protein [Sporolactobacillus spathodeae]
MNLILSQWKEIFHTRTLFISVIGLMFVPLLYGGIFLSAFWDPYGHANQLKVAVVNQDNHAQLSGRSIALGGVLTDNLKKNKTFHWVFLKDRNSALKNLQQQNYYMVIVIPPNFSNNAAALLSGKTMKQMTLRYYTNSGESYTAAQMVKGIIPGIDRRIARAVTESYAQTMFAMLHKVNQEWKLQSHRLTKAAEKIKPLVNGSGEMNQGLKKLASSSLLFQQGLHQARQGSAQLDIGIHSLHTGLKTLDQKISKLNRGQKRLNAGISETAAGGQKLHQQMKKFNRAQQKFNAQFALILDFLKQIYPNYAAQNISKQQLITLLETWEAAAVQNHQPVPASFETWLTQLGADSAQNYNIASLMAATQKSSVQLATSAQSLTNASQSMADALSQINSGAKSISDGMKGIQRGSGLLYAGAGRIMNGNDQLSQGLGILDKQQGKLSDGARALYSGSNQMNSGINDLNQKINQFKTQVANGANTPDSFVGNSKKQADLLAKPERSQVKDLNPVNNYGEGLSPYILSLGLFVGALAFATFFPLRKPSEEPTSSLFWYLSKFSVSAAISIFQAVLICTLMLTVVGLKVTSVSQFYFFTIMSSLSFFAIAQFLGTAFNNIGRAIGGLLLLLQFGGSSGIFPVSLTPIFFQWIHALLPMSYSVNGLRQVISIGGDPVYLLQQTLMLLCMGIISMLLTWLTFHLLLKKKSYLLNSEEMNESPL